MTLFPETLLPTCDYVVAMSQTFVVDDVPRASELLPTRSLIETYSDALTFGGDPEIRVVDHGPTHALLGAVHLAFAEHRPLVLSPDAVWLTIAQGFAQHVRLHAEALRPRLVRHSGTERLEISWNGPMPDDAASWKTIVAEFRGKLAEHIGEGRARLFECDFSTSTEVDRIASQVVLLDAFAPYFDYFLACVCGIPEITLLGTTTDWQRIRERIDVLAEFDLAFWTQSLAPICDEFVKASAGRPDRVFWQRIYKPREAYGGDIITGWIARFYPYLVDCGNAGVRNPLLEMPIDEPKGDDEERWYNGPGIRSNQVVATPSTVRIHVVDLARNEKHLVALDGGVTIVAQEPEGKLVPRSNWALRRSSLVIGDVIERIRKEQTFVAAEPRCDRAWWNLTGSADFMAIYHAFEEATLFADKNPWRILRPREHENVLFSLPYNRTTDVKRIVDLPDGTFLAATDDVRKPILVRGRIDTLEPLPPPREDLTEIEQLGVRRPSRQAVEDVPIIGLTLAEVLAWALDHEGATDLPESGRFLDVIPQWLLAPPPPQLPRRERKRRT